MFKPMSADRLVLVAALIMATLTALPVPAAYALETSLQYVLTLSGDITRREVLYDCEGLEAPIPVEYVDAAPNFLAILPIDGEKMIFANIQADKGVIYAAGAYQWRVDGAETALYDKPGDPAAAPKFTCIEHNNIP